MEFIVKQFIEDLNEWNIDITSDQLDMFELYTKLLLEWNQRINLTAITEISEIYKKHYLDSLSLIKSVNDIGINKYSLLDLGTGAGFPGIPLKIMFPKLDITLVDSLNKRIDFLNIVINELGLNDIKAIHSRAEDLAHDPDHRESYDIVTSRAVANLSVLSEYCLPFVKVGGLFVSYKSGNAIEEIYNSKNAFGMLGGKLSDTVDFLLPSSDFARMNVSVKKIKATEERFPRKAGTPSKKPL